MSHQKTPPYTVVTVANKVPQEWYFTFVEFFKSLQDVDPIVLGTKQGQYGGLGSKPRLLHEAINNGTINTKYIIFCDCFDLVFAVHPDELFETYLKFRSPIVISAEKNCFPADLKAEYDLLGEEFDTPFKYLNSGMIVGETEATFAALNSMDAPNIPNDYWDAEKNCMINPNDQEYWQHEFLKQPVQITLDRFQILSRTLHDADVSELDFSKEHIRNIETNTYPCSYHFNGGGKTGNCRNPILQHLKLI